MPLDDFENNPDWDIEDPVHGDIYKRAEHLLQTRRNDIHTRISYHFAMRLLTKEGGNPEVVAPAILLHDIGYSEIPEDQLLFAFGPKIEKPELKKLHETAGAELAGKILHEIDYPEERIIKIQQIINGHDSRETALSLEDMIVKDADKLFRFSHEGFIIDYQRFKREPHEWINYLKQHIEPWFFTASGEKMAQSEIEKRKKEL
ncbi:HD domain-containing protein [Thermodesulfobacteriota bacterium]